MDTSNPYLAASSHVQATSLEISYPDKDVPHHKAHTSYRKPVGDKPDIYTTHLHRLPPQESSSEGILPNCFRFFYAKIGSS